MSIVVLEGVKDRRDHCTMPDPVEPQRREVKGRCATTPDMEKSAKAGDLDHPLGQSLEHTHDLHGPTCSECSNAFLVFGRIVVREVLYKRTQCVHGRLCHVGVHCGLQVTDELRRHGSTSGAHVLKMLAAPASCVMANEHGTVCKPPSACLQTATCLFASERAAVQRAHLYSLQQQEQEQQQRVSAPSPMRMPIDGL